MVYEKGNSLHFITKPSLKEGCKPVLNKALKMLQHLKSLVWL